MKHRGAAPAVSIDVEDLPGTKMRNGVWGRGSNGEVVFTLSPRAGKYNSLAELETAALEVTRGVRYGSLADSGEYTRRTSDGCGCCEVFQFGDFVLDQLTDAHGQIWIDDVAVFTAEDVNANNTRTGDSDSGSSGVEKRTESSGSKKFKATFKAFKHDLFVYKDIGCRAKKAGNWAGKFDSVEISASYFYVTVGRATLGRQPVPSSARSPVFGFQVNKFKRRDNKVSVREFAVGVSVRFAPEIDSETLPADYGGHIVPDAYASPYGTGGEIPGGDFGTPIPYGRFDGIPGGTWVPNGICAYFMVKAKGDDLPAEVQKGPVYPECPTPYAAERGLW